MWQVYCISNLCLHKPSTSRDKHTHNTPTKTIYGYTHTCRHSYKHTAHRPFPYCHLDTEKGRGSQSKWSLIRILPIMLWFGGGWVRWLAKLHLTFIKWIAGRTLRRIACRYALCDAGYPLVSIWQISYRSSELTRQEKIRWLQLNVWLKGRCWRRWSSHWGPLRCHKTRKDDS